MSNKSVCICDFEHHAKRVLPKAVFDYYFSGADEQETLADNVAAFSRWRLFPRVLRNVSRMDLSATVLGQRLSMPVCVAATAMQRMAHPDGETATARACLLTGTGMMLSSWATSTIEEVAEAAPDAVRWMQLYIYKDRALTHSLVRRAEEAGYKGIFVTVDTPYLGRRRDDVRNRFRLPSHLRMANFESPDLAFSSKKGYGEDSGLAVYVSEAIDPTLKWEDVAWLKRITSLPVVVKGVLRGRTDGEIDALPEIVEAVEGRVEIYLDGGIRRGTDVLKALALGAKAVFVGRPILWGLACEGEKGVSDVLQLLREELHLALALTGHYQVMLVNDCGLDECQQDMVQKEDKVDMYSFVGMVHCDL
ncbi:hypothetical protein P4O66_001667 [Electrophorus voltai]|uniref:(S)-2-hydroxy-acid oxidase n=1 Tax=Electrophorus voltai TaxID=2609070 RepID=A0AAD8Z4F6_9TELE|nr:hypothetical protein P4O66_001667 [Electrophorus voltai]